MIDKEKTIANLVKLSFADLFALMPIAGNSENGYLRLIYSAIEIKMAEVLVQYQPELA